MQWVKKLWFPVSTVLLVGVIGFNTYRLVAPRLSSSNDTNSNVVSQGSGTRDNPERVRASIPDLVSSPGPRDIVFRLKPTNGEANIDGQKLTAALEALGPVEHATFEDDTIKLTIASSLKVSELVERLGFQQIALVEEEFPLRGGLRLHVSGMT